MKILWFQKSIYVDFLWWDINYWHAPGQHILLSFQVPVSNSPWPSPPFELWLFGVTSLRTSAWVLGIFWRHSTSTQVQPITFLHSLFWNITFGLFVCVIQKHLPGKKKKYLSWKSAGDDKFYFLRLLANNLHIEAIMAPEITWKGMYVKLYIEARSVNHCCRGKELNITSSECVSVALVIQHAMRMCRIILSSVVCPAVQYFCTLCQSQRDFRGRFEGGVIIEHKIWVLFVSREHFLF